ncbi:unnamed protein product [Clavelina lepadiformis]|uniref:Alkylglycerol monooxygenase C-terminal domain-containing protein n=1 Tax=Clavelina lepadiformis TaxID=159417 RepID=A0ABP0FVG3_CLALP
MQTVNAFRISLNSRKKTLPSLLVSYNEAGTMKTFIVADSIHVRCNNDSRVEKPIIKHDPNVSNWISAYALVHYVGLVPLYDNLMLLRHTLSAPSQALDVTIQMSTAMCMGFLFDKKPYAYISELVRCLLIATFFVTQQTDLEESHELLGVVVQVLQLLYLLSAFIWFLALVMGDRDKGKLD